MLTVSYELVASPMRVTRLAEQLASLLGVTLAQPSPLEALWRSKLHALLLPAVGSWADES